MNRKNTTTRTGYDLIDCREKSNEYYFDIQILGALEKHTINYSQLNEFLFLLNPLAEVNWAATANGDFEILETEIFDWWIILSRGTSGFSSHQSCSLILNLRNSQGN